MSGSHEISGFSPDEGEEGWQSRQKLLFVCARNKIRSVTAERLFAGSPFYDVKSRGVSREARIRLTAADLAWADLVFVMEKNHKDRIVKDFRSSADPRRIIVLFIEDIYEPMASDLVEILREKLEAHIQVP